MELDYLSGKIFKSYVLRLFMRSFYTIFLNVISIVLLKIDANRI